MKTVINPKAFLSSIFKKCTGEGKDFLSSNDDNSANSIHEVGVFSNYRDVKVALEELEEVGFSLNEMTLIARNCQHHHWLPGLNICDRFEPELFESNETAKNFFQRLYQQGKYLLVVTGEENDLNSAGAIISRRKEHGRVWRF